MTSIEDQHHEAAVAANKGARRIAELEAALKPFADAASLYDGVPPSKYFGDTSCEHHYPATTKHTVTVSELRAARNALTKSNS